MKMNILKSLILLVVTVLPVAAAAQNLDPTVVVNRAYEGRLLEVHKPSMTMNVPDTVRRFDLDFDYSVFENPYKGSYEFKPYELLMNPFASSGNMPSFWVKAGAGYTLHPVMELVWTPVKKGDFKMSLYADYNAYFGGFRTFKPEPEEGVLNLGRWRTENGKTSLWNGYWMKSKAGLQGQYDWQKGHMSFDVGYFGTVAKDTLKSRAINGIDVNLNLASKPRSDVYFHYDIDVDYSMAADRMSFATYDASLTEHDFGFGAELGAVIAGSHHLLFDMGMQVLGYSGEFGVSATEMSITPHYLMTKGNWNINLGVKLAKLILPEDSPMYQVKDQVIYPDVTVRYSAFDGALGIYAKAGGGNILNTYTGMVADNPFADIEFGRGSPLLDATVERISLVLGLDGRISKRFMYDLHAGYSNCKNGLFDTVVSDGSGYLPGIGYASYNKLYAGLDWDWRAKAVSFNGGIRYAHYTGVPADLPVFLPAVLTGKVDFEYNWNRRIFAGVDCRFSSARKGMIGTYDAVMPGFADLGLYGEYSFNDKLSFWLRGGNLLNMTVQYSPLYAEKGLNFTAGICFKL